MRLGTCSARLTLILVFGVLLGGCKGGVNVGIDEETRKKVDDLAKVVQTSMLTLSDSIPGGRYTRLIEDLNGPDSEKKKRLNYS